MIPLALALLAVVDAAFAGFRAAAGRNARIFKGRYYRQSLALGAVSGAGLVAVLATCTAVVLASSADPARSYAELLVIGARMLWVLGTYAALVVLALVVYCVSDWNLRSLATVAILGPFTLLRPWTIALACLVALANGASAPACWLTVVSGGSVVLLGRALDFAYARAQRRDLNRR